MVHGEADLSARGFVSLFFLARPPSHAFLTAGTFCVPGAGGLVSGVPVNIPRGPGGPREGCLPFPPGNVATAHACSSFSQAERREASRENLHSTANLDRPVGLWAAIGVCFGLAPQLLTSQFSLVTPRIQDARGNKHSENSRPTDTH